MSAFPAFGSDQSRSMWVWDDPDEAIITFAVERGIDRLFLNANPGFSAELAFAEFLTATHAAGLEVYALSGDPTWATEGGVWTAWVEEVVAHGGFDGLAPDVEPYLLPGWQKSRTQRSIVRSFERELRSAAAASASLPLLATVPFWFDEISFKKGTLLEAVVDRADGIVVLAYRDFAAGPDGIIEHTRTEMELAAEADKPVIVGVETAPAGLDKITFAEEGTDEMEAQLALVIAEYQSVSAFDGVAIHHYGTYLTLAP